jgi:hypothetical protein
MPHPLRLLRPRRQRARRSCAAEQRYELAPLQSIKRQIVSLKNDNS